MYDAIIVGALCRFDLGAAAPQTDRFFGTVAGSISISDFYSMDNVGSIMSESALEMQAV